MAVNISDKLAWVRSHLRVWLAVSCCSLLLLIPRVMSVVVFFWPLIVSTALFVAALLTVSASASASCAASATVSVPLELEDHSLAGARGVEEGESSFSVEENCAQKDSNRSLLECVKEQLEGGLMLFESMFDRERPTAGLDDGLTRGGEHVEPAARELKNGENPSEATDAAKVTRNGEERADDAAAAESRTERDSAGELAGSRPEHQNEGP